MMFSGRLREEKNNWKNCDLPEEIEKERRKWMKLMEQTLNKEKENWRARDLPQLRKVSFYIYILMEQTLNKEKENWRARDLPQLRKVGFYIILLFNLHDYFKNYKTW